jgi:ubiquinone/menaquinone biosynthesis C-methylase UbiE
VRVHWYPFSDILGSTENAERTRTLSLLELYNISISSDTVKIFPVRGAKMSESGAFSFGDQSVATAYDNVLVAVLFKPWAAQLVEKHGPWKGRRILDLAAGTGVVAQMLADQVGPDGKVIAADINAEMLGLAKQRCAGTDPAVEFVESPAYPLKVASESVDTVVCQQGFQFFPDKVAAACEVCRVLGKGGRAIATTWRPVEECQFFGAICRALETIGEPDIADLMRVPFDFMPEAELKAAFTSAGFTDLRLEQEESPFLVSGGFSRAIEVAHATPIGPKLRALPEEKQAQFRQRFSECIDDLSSDGVNMGRMVSNVLSAAKSSA